MKNLLSQVCRCSIILDYNLNLYKGLFQISLIRRKYNVFYSKLLVVAGEKGGVRKIEGSFYLHVESLYC